MISHDMFPAMIEENLAVSVAVARQLGSRNQDVIVANGMRDFECVANSEMSRIERGVVDRYSPIRIPGIGHYEFYDQDTSGLTHIAYDALGNPKKITYFPDGHRICLNACGTLIDETYLRHPAELFLAGVGFLKHIGEKRQRRTFGYSQIIRDVLETRLAIETDNSEI